MRVDGAGSQQWLLDECLLPQPKQDQSFICFLLAGLLACWGQAFNSLHWVKSVCWVK